MAKRFSDLKNKLTPEDHVEIEKRVAEALAEMPLDKIRKAHNMTQVAIAEKLQVNQAAVSKLESRADAYISTLRDYIEALGGQLVLRAEFPEGTVNISMLGESEAQVANRR